jgi:enterochelin esterase-like enzyme
VVFINEQPNLFGPPTPYAAMVAEELVPFVDSTYRTRAAAESRASIGAGWLGFPAYFCALAHPGTFGRLGTQSAFLIDVTMQGVAAMMKTADQQPLDTYVGWARYDMRGPKNENWSIADINRQLFTLLQEKGYEPSGGENNDGTGWSSWVGHTGELLEALFPMGS